MEYTIINSSLIPHEEDEAEEGQKVEIAVVIDRHLEFFNGEYNNLYRKGSVPTPQLLSALAMRSDLTFNIPRTMLEKGWENERIVFKNGFIYVVKDYKDRSGNKFRQTLRTDGVVIFIMQDIHCRIFLINLRDIPKNQL